MLSVAYITLFLGSVLAGVVFDAGHLDGIILGYLIAFVFAVLLMPLLDPGTKAREEEHRSWRSRSEED